VWQLEIPVNWRVLDHMTASFSSSWNLVRFVVTVFVCLFVCQNNEEKFNEIFSGYKPYHQTKTGRRFRDDLCRDILRASEEKFLALAFQRKKQ
jgi:hypothetical protein